MAVQMMDSPLNFEESGEEEKKGLQGQSLTDIIQQEVMKLMKGKMQLENNQVNFAHLGDFAGVNYSLQVIDCLEVGTWIVDTGYLFVEVLLVVILSLLSQKSYNPPNRPLTKKEIDELCDEWVLESLILIISKEMLYEPPVLERCK
ncbi:hypothetical protein Pint_22534 [Pistacia integerrima]|uniref:Uncharacterized protein n=1 Tax=Pistacia integerrima TaxID=434235 RepID=A0ACC0YKL3_9ROSI|nr:hypothetical protein Pint_22534 [Pistacia integerrima]